MNKILLITGASSDIGIELIQKTESNYGTILAHYHDSSEKLTEMKKRLGEKLVLLQADFSDENGAEHLISKINELQVLPNHIVHLPAVKAFSQKFHKIQWSEYEKGMNVSLRSVVKILKEYIPGMAKQKYGKIVFMLTSCILDKPPKYQSSYVTVKYALWGLMKSLSAEYADKGITVNGISPDMIETKFLSELPDLIIQQNAMNSPIGRNLSVHDVVPAIGYLLSDAADTITGQNLGITGGL